jgi:hypothetical protein
VSALEQPLDRVNYFNGQRLDAADFRADQDYQMRVRRMLFSSLYSIGIVQGLEVTKHPTDPHKVRVAPGVALDVIGREIILLDSTDVQVAGTPSPSPGVIFGNFLVIAYAEQRVQPVSDGCVATSAAGGCGGNLAWGAPTRIRAAPKLEMVDTWPSDQSGRIVLAQIGLQAGCQVSEIQSGVRRYAVAAQPPTVHPISLEGEKDIDASNPKTLYFHVDGGVPDLVTLYLRADEFASFHYTEMGGHSHAVGLTTADTVLALRHTHTASTGTTDEAADHTHNYLVDGGETTGGIDVNDQQVVGRTNTDNSAILPSGKHTHQVSGLTLDMSLQDGPHHHAVSGSTATAGATDLAARGGNRLRYFDTLKVLYDGQDITAQILGQLNGTDPANWPATAKLGDGTNAHALVVNGTGKIDLTQIGLDFTPGEHSLTFQVSGAGNGGQIKYNLYVA